MAQSWLSPDSSAQKPSHFYEKFKNEMGTDPPQAVDGFRGLSPDFAQKNYLHSIRNSEKNMDRPP